MKNKIDSAVVPAILLGGSETAVPVCRSLGRAGVPVIALGQAGDPISRSRYCSRFIEVEGGLGIEQRWLDALTSEPTPGVFVPVSDYGVEAVVHNRDALSELGYVPFEADTDAMLTVLDKGRSYERAAAAGVPTPKSIVLREPEDLIPALDGLEFPCGLKPLEGHLFREHTGSTAKVIVVEDRDEFVALVGPWLKAGLGLMVTEIIGGPDDQIYALFTHIDKDGKPLYRFTNRKLRQDPPHFGVGSYVCQEEQPEVIELGLRFLDAIGYRGFGHVEFKRDPVSKTFKLIECNPRISLPIALLIACGLDVPLFMYRRLMGEASPAPTMRRSGLYLWHPVPDFRSAKQLRAERELTWPGWVRSLLHRQLFTLWARDDPWPSIVVNATTFYRAIANRLWRRGDAAG